MSVSSDLTAVSVFFNESVEKAEQAGTVLRFFHLQSDNSNKSQYQLQLSPVVADVILFST